jgi:hypothetical protein
VLIYDSQRDSKADERRTFRFPLSALKYQFNENMNKYVNLPIYIHTGHARKSREYAQYVVSHSHMGHYFTHVLSHLFSKREVLIIFIIYICDSPPDDSYTDETDCTCCGLFEVKRKIILRSIYMVLSTVCVS